MDVRGLATRSFTCASKSGRSATRSTGFRQKIYFENTPGKIRIKRDGALWFLTGRLGWRTPEPMPQTQGDWRRGSESNEVLRHQPKVTFSRESTRLPSSYSVIEEIVEGFVEDILEQSSDNFGDGPIPAHF